MRALIQRVKSSKVYVDGGKVAEIGAGLLIFLGIGRDDEERDIEKLSRKIANLRIFEDGKGKMNLNILQSGGEVLSVPQFTLYADTSRGNRPGFDMSAPSSTAEEYWVRFNKRLAESGVVVKKGIFAAGMEVELVNDGPVTIWLDSKEERR